MASTSALGCLLKLVGTLVVVGISIALFSANNPVAAFVVGGIGSWLVWGVRWGVGGNASASTNYVSSTPGEPLPAPTDTPAPGFEFSGRRAVALVAAAIGVPITILSAIGFVNSIRLGRDKEIVVGTGLFVLFGLALAVDGVVAFAKNRRLSIWD